MRPRHSRQRDLFERDREIANIPDTRRSILIHLIECLLVEALTDGSGEARLATHTAKEAKHEQDHA